MSLTVSQMLHAVLLLMISLWLLSIPTQFIWRKDAHIILLETKNASFASIRAPDFDNKPQSFLWKSHSVEGTEKPKLRPKETPNENRDVDNVHTEKDELVVLKINSQFLGKDGNNNFSE